MSTNILNGQFVGLPQWQVESKVKSQVEDYLGGHLARNGPELNKLIGLVEEFKSCRFSQTLTP